MNILVDKEELTMLRQERADLFARAEKAEARARHAEDEAVEVIHDLRVKLDVAEGALCRAKEKARYTGASDCQVTYRANDDPRGLLVEGAVYDVEHIDEGEWHTDVYLVGHEGKRFNSVSFDLFTETSTCPHELAEKRLAEDHVAYLCYRDHGDHPTTIHICDSDSPGAFKVYRRAGEAG